MGEIEPFRAIDRIDLANEPEFDLGGLRVIPPQRVVVMNGQRRELQPRVMQVLVALAKAGSAVVSRQRLSELCWDSRIVGDDALNHVILALRRLAEDFTPSPFAIETVPRVGHRLVVCPTQANVETNSATRRGSRSIVAAAIAMLALLAVVAVVLTRPWSVERAPTVLVTAAAKDSASRQLATDLATKLGSLQAGHPAAMRLLGGTAGPSENPDLILQVSRVADPARTAATAILTASQSSTILWSNEFEQPSRNVSDLSQQVAYTVAHLLRCASEGLASEDSLTNEILKTYLSACAPMSDLAAYDARPVVRTLETVVRNSPHFVAGWAKLLQAETEAFTSPVVPAGAAAAPSLKRHILAARRLEPHLPEAFIAEYVLTRPVDFIGRARLLDQAVERSPQHAGVRAERSLFFQSAGAVDDALREAREAVRLDPLSPALRDTYVAVLAAIGDTKAALAAAAEVERIWPGSPGAIESRYRIHLRYGDPREALRLINSRAVDMPVAPLHRTYLLARIDPSPANFERAIRQARTAYRDYPATLYNYAQTLAEFGRKDEVLHLLINARDRDELALSMDVLFRPALREIRRDPRFMHVAKRAGLLDYWRQSGNWPDFCYAPDLPYDCKAEAAKLGQ